MLSSYSNKKPEFRNPYWIQKINKQEIYNDITKRKGLVFKCKHKYHISPTFLPVRCFSLKNINHQTKLPSLQSYCKSCYKKDYAKKVLEKILFDGKERCTNCSSIHSFFSNQNICRNCTSNLQFINTFIYMPDKDNKEYIKDTLCCICGTTSNLLVNYICPIEKGGADTIQNKHTICFTCSQNNKNVFSVNQNNLHCVSERYQKWLLLNSTMDLNIDKLLEKEVSQFKKIQLYTDNCLLRENIRIYSKKHGISVDVDRLIQIFQKLKVLME
jgi:hypothetical protein